MRHRLTIALSLVIVLLLATVVAGYQRASALACTTAAFDTWDAGGAHGARACLLYLALGPDGGPHAQAGTAEGANAAKTAPSPSPSPEESVAAAATAPPQHQASAAPAPSPEPVTPEPVTPVPSSTSPPAMSAEAPDPSTYEEADFGTHTVTCSGKAYRYWQEVARFYGEDDSCRAWATAVGLDVDGADGEPAPSFHSSGETQMYFQLLDEDLAAWD